MITNTLTEILILSIAYLFGSIPFGLLISWVFELQDPRKAGSQSIGATNILRSGHKSAALLTLLLDALKGSAAVIFALIVAPPLAQLACIFAVIGHIWPIWLGFRGGKGVATAIGGIVILSWPLALTCVVTWLVIAMTTRYSSLAALISALLSPLYIVFLGGEDLVVTCLMIAVLLVWTHRHNIGRLITGSEPKIGENNPPNPS